MSFAVRSDTTLGRLLARKQLPAIGAVVLLFNAMTGPGIPFTPACFGNPGVWPTVLLFVVFAGISSMSMLLIVEAMQAIPGNAAFQGVVEYATLVNFYFGRWAHAAAQVFLYGAVQSNVCMSVVMAAQLTDHLLVAWAGKTCGLAVDGWKCVGEAGHGASPFGDEFMIFTLGLVVVVGIVMPLGFINLEDMRVQYGSFVLSVLILVQWSLSASTYTFDRVKLAMPPSNSYSVVAGTIMLNLAATTIIPSWINLKAKDVNVQMTVWFSVAGAALVYILVGLSIAVGYDNITNTVLPVIQAHGIPKVLSKLSVYMFAYVMLIPSIPVNMAISYDNLVQNKIASKPIAKFACYIVPIILCIPLQTGSILVVFQTWTSLLFVSVANFIIPALVYFQCLYFRRMYNQDRQLTPNQLNILERIHVQSSSIGRFLQKMRHSSEGAPELLIFDETIPAGSNGQPVLTLTPVISHERTEDDEWSMVPDPDLEDYLLDPQQVHFPSKDATLSSLLTSLPRPALGDIERRHTSWRDSYDISRAISMSDPMKRANGSTPLARRITFNAANAPVPEFDHPMPIIDEAQLTTTSNPSVKSPGLMPPGQLMPLLIVSPSNTSEKAPTSAPASAKYPDSLAVPTPYGDYFGPTNLSRAKTLPTHPSFTTPAFRSIPLVLGRYGIRGHHAAAIVLLLVSAVVLLNVVLVITAWVSID